MADPELVDSVVSSASGARSVLLRVAGDGGVLEQLEGRPKQLADAPNAQLKALAEKLLEVTESVQRLRADEIGELLVNAARNLTP
jgi:hypothetical protein